MKEPSLKQAVGFLSAIAFLSAIGAALNSRLSPWGYIVAGASALIAVLLVCQMLSRRLWMIEERIANSDHSTTTSVASELHSMQIILNRFPQCTMPTSGWSMRFANLHAVVDVLDRLAPSTVVEFGSGVSTLCVAAWMQEKGRGRIVSFDHDAGWAEVTRRYLTAHGLNEYSKVITAPLTENLTDANGTLWYDITPHLRYLSGIELLIVDGPPAGLPERELSRLPALPALHDRLSPTAVIVLDDAKRPGETEVVHRWLSHFPEYTIRTGGGVSGVAILERAKPDRPITSKHLSALTARV